MARVQHSTTKVMLLHSVKTKTGCVPEVRKSLSTKTRQIIVSINIFTASQMFPRFFNRSQLVICHRFFRVKKLEKLKEQVAKHASLVKSLYVNQHLHGL